MATVVQKPLQLEEANVEQYCSADGLSLNAGGYAIRKWLNGSTSGYAILNDAAKEVLYPTTTSHPFKIDSEIRGSRSAGSMTVNLEFGETVVQSESYTSTSLSTRTKTDITDSVVTDSSRDTQIRWNVQGANANTQRVAHVKLVLYFYQYSMSANIGTDANGVQSVSVSDSAPYYGDTVTFTPKLVNGATWDGWYSDAECTQLVSTSQSYSVAATDLTLYAKATIDAVLYSCSAVAGENIASAIVSDEKVVLSESVTFTATPSEHCTFDGWFSDSGYTSLVSTANPYTAVITSDTTLYAKGTKISYSISIGTAEHGTATVSANTAHYGDSVTFTFTPEDETWELYGWYSDAGHTQLVSEDNPYIHTITDDITLYPLIGLKRYSITLYSPGNLIQNSATTISAISVNTSLATVEDMRNLRSGDFTAIDSSKVYDYKASSRLYTDSYGVTITAPFGSTVALYAAAHAVTDDIKTVYFLYNNIQVTNGPHYVFTAAEDARYETIRSPNLPNKCTCSAIKMSGIKFAEVYPKTVIQESTTEFSAEVEDGYAFSGWYSDNACTTLVSTDNPAYVTTPKYTTESASATSLTLYAKATKASTTGTGIYLKTNGAHQEAIAVYKKVNGTWVQQDDPKSLFLGSPSGSESNYIYCGDL